MHLIAFGQRAQPNFGISVRSICILPDHVHFFVRLGEDTPLGRWILDAALMAQTHAHCVTRRATATVYLISRKFSG